MQTETEGLTAVHVDLRFDMAELEGWSPDRLEALFDGIAKVVAASNGDPVRREAGGEEGAGGA